jgi:hypothetical protein
MRITDLTDLAHNDELARHDKPLVLEARSARLRDNTLAVVGQKPAPPSLHLLLAKEDGGAR